MSHLPRNLRPWSLAATLVLAACPSANTDPGKAVARTDAKQTDAKQPDAKQVDAKQADAKQADANLAPVGDAPTPPVVEPTPPVEPTPVAPSPEIEQAIATSINAFAVDLHRELGAKPGNLFVSPASIAIAFAMTHAGAKGATASELAKALHFPATDLHAGLGATLARWDGASGGLELDVANRLFGEKTVPFEPAFVELTRATFAAPLEPLDFVGASEASRKHINDWVATQTRDKIRDLLPPSGVNAATRLVLVNAIYFKAQWSDAFETSATKDAPFIGGTSHKTAKMMHRVGHYSLGVVPEAKLRTLEIPYAGGEYSMVVVLPDEAKGLAAIEKALDAETLRGWIDGATGQRVAVGLPRFRIEPGAALQLRAPLEKLGVVTAWDAERADFTGMAPPTHPLTISEAYHKAFVAVDEAGTEAAAATAVSMKAGSAAPTDEPVPFVADHPFLFVVRDTKTGAILFMGRLVDP